MPPGDGGNHFKSERRNKKEKKNFKNKHPSLERRLARPKDTEGSGGPNELGDFGFYPHANLLRLCKGFNIWM